MTDGSAERGQNPSAETGPAVDEPVEDAGSGADAAPPEGEPQTGDEDDSPARDMTVNVGIVTALVLTPLVWVLLEGALTLASHHPGSWQLRLVTVGVTNLLFWSALGIDESRDDDVFGLAAVGWLVVLLPLWLLTEAAVVALDLTALAGIEQTYLRLGISGLSALFFGVLLDRRRAG